MRRWGKTGAVAPARSGVCVCEKEWGKTGGKPVRVQARQGGERGCAQPACPVAVPASPSRMHSPNPTPPLLTAELSHAPGIIRVSDWAFIVHSFETLASPQGIRHSCTV